MVRIAGLDLAALPKNPTGWALMEGRKIETRLLYGDEEIMGMVRDKKPQLVAIDAPLSLPKSGIYRKADEEMIKRGYRVFPPVIPSMKKLTLRAMELVASLREEEVDVIEIHPLSTRKALGMPLRDPGEISKTFEALGFELSGGRTIHELDAATAALTGLLHIKGLTEELGDEGGKIVVPRRISWEKLELWK